MNREKTIIDSIEIEKIVERHLKLMDVLFLWEGNNILIFPKKNPVDDEEINDVV